MSPLADGDCPSLCEPAEAQPAARRLRARIAVETGRPNRGAGGCRRNAAEDMDAMDGVREDEPG
jgi:hypothetical protein